MSQIVSKNNLWEFIDDDASFRVAGPHRYSRLYFPLGNEAGILSSITPDLHGDIKTSHNSFLTLPVSIEDLHNIKESRNFWAYVEKNGAQDFAWSLTGVSAAQNAPRFLGKEEEKTSLEAGMLWHRVTRENASLGLRSEITNFVPVSADHCEVMIVTIANTGASKVRVTPTSAIPVFGRSADNLRDHYHVTSLLHRIIQHPAGIVVKPTMTFDERGHKINETLYAVLGTTGAGDMPTGAFSTVPDFIGEGGNFEKPRAVLENLDPPLRDENSYHGKSAIGALRFKPVNLAPREKTSYVLILGITQKMSEIESWVKKFGTLAKANAALEENRRFWAQKTCSLRFQTQDKAYNGWIRWVGLQPTLRKIFGCSFLPDFDYGRGGRGWRDLWQDCLALLLASPLDARPMLLHNFGGIRIDGSNATIIGKSGEFIADRNNITRVWMDHGVWPYLTLELYIHQTGDFGILFEDVPYFRDRQQSRARVKDPLWTEAEGSSLKTKKGQVVKSSVLEHLLVQHLVQFFNVGEHNHIRLEHADWNDGLDMAYDRGESVAFTTLYGSNLAKMADLIEEAAKRMEFSKVEVAKELSILLDRAFKGKVDYHSVTRKKHRLERYFHAVQPYVTGKRLQVPVKKLAADLREKSAHILSAVRQKEWVQTRSGDGLFNGYYDNHGRRVEGDFPHGFHMTLAGQTFPIMSGAATPQQVTEIFKTAKKHLKDKQHGGFRLNTDFHEIRLDLGRAFSFAYGEKENGAFFSHMAVMFANALYQRGFVDEGHEVLDSIFKMAMRTEKSRIYPGIPEYFNSEGRGLYHYLTGSASWFILTVLTQMFGVRGRYGDLLLAPKFTRQDFATGHELSVEAMFAGKRLRVVYRNPKKIGYKDYCVTKVMVNGKELKGLELNKKDVLIAKYTLLANAKKPLNEIIVTLE